MPVFPVATDSSPVPTAPIRAHVGLPSPPLGAPRPSACLRVAAKCKWWWLTLAIMSSEEIALFFLLGWSWLISTTGSWVPQAESTPSLKGWGWTSRSHCEIQELFSHWLLVGKSFTVSPGWGRPETHQQAACIEHIVIISIPTLRWP